MNYRKVFITGLVVVSAIAISTFTGLSFWKADEKNLLSNRLTEFVSAERVNGEFQGKLKELGLTYKEASLITVKKDQSGGYYFSIKDTENKLYATKIKNNLVNIEKEFKKLMNKKNAKVDDTVLKNEIVKTMKKIKNVLGTSAELELQLLHFSDIDGGGNILKNVRNFSALVNKFRGEYPNNTILLSSGDNWIPGPEYEVAADPSLAPIFGIPGRGRGHIRFLNELGVQASAFGNHEWDQGPDQVAAIIGPETKEGSTDKWEGAQFPYLASNLDFSGNAALKKLVTKPGQSAETIKGKITSYTTVTVDGQKIGIVSGVSNALDRISNLGEVTVTTGSLASLAARIQKDVDALTEKGINKIIMLGHMQQLSLEEQLAPLLSGVDIIIGGGSNTILADDNDKLWSGDVAAGVYPISLKSKDGKDVLVVNTDHDYTYLGRLVVKFDEDGFIMPNSLDTKINGAYLTDFDITSNAFDATTVDPEITKVADGLKRLLDVKRGNIIGYTNVYINGDRKFVRTEETNFGDLSADANLYYAKLYDSEVTLAFKNGGGIRGPIGNCDLPAGKVDIKDLICSPPKRDPSIPNSKDKGISQLDIETSLRFNNGLVVANRVTPRILKGILENGFGRSVDKKTGYRQETGSFPQVAGMKVEYDLRNRSYKRVTKITLDDSEPNTPGKQPLVIVENGSVVDAYKSKTWKMVILDYNIPSSIPKNARTALSATSQGLPDDNTFIKGKEQAALAAYLRTHHGTLATAFNEPDNRFDPNHVDSRLIDKTPEGRIIPKRIVIGYTNVYLNNNDMYRGTPFPSRETNLGNLLTDALVYYGKKYDQNVVIGIANNGGIRSSVGECSSLTDSSTCNKPSKSPTTPGSVAGEITASDIESVYPFNNGLFILGLTPTQIWEIFKSAFGSKKGIFDPRIQVSGLKVEYDKSQEDSDFKIRKITVIDSEPNTPGKQPLVIWNNYVVVKNLATRIFKVVIDSYTVGKNPIRGFNLSAANKVDLTSATMIGTDTDDTFDKGYRRDSIAEYLKDKHGTPAKAFNIEDKPGSITDSSMFTRLIDGPPGQHVEKTIFGYTNVYLNYDDCYNRETNLGNLLTDALLAYGKMADQQVLFAVAKGGGIKASIGVCTNKQDKSTCVKPPEGEIDKTAIENTYKYNNGIYIVSLTPEQIRNLLGSAMRQNDVNKFKPGIQVSGLIVEYINHQNRNERIKKITIADSNPTLAGNQPLVIWNNGAVVGSEANKKFKLAIDSYEVERGFIKYLKLPANLLIDLRKLVTFNGGTDTTFKKGTRRDSLAEYLKANHGTSATAYNVEDKPGSTTFTATRLLNKGTTPPVNPAVTLGYTNVYLNHDDRYKRETNLGDLLTDALKAYGKMANQQILFAVAKGGGIRASIGVCTNKQDKSTCVKPPKGIIDKTAIEKTYGFNNGIYIVSLTPEQIRNLLGSAMRQNDVNKYNPGIQVSGLIVEYDSKFQNQNERIRKITIADSNPTLAGNQPLVIWNNGVVVTNEANKKFKLAIDSYEVERGFIKKLNLPANLLIDLRKLATFSGGTDTTFKKGTRRDSLAEYLKANHGTTATAYNIEDKPGSTTFKATRLLDKS